MLRGLFRIVALGFIRMVVLIFLAENHSYTYGQPCPQSTSIFTDDYLYSNLKETTRMISNYAYLDASTETTTQNLLYIFKQNGNQGIYDLDESTLLNSFTIDNLSTLTAWDFSFNQRIFYHTLDTLGNVYEVDGNYGRLNQKFAVVESSITVQSGACLSYTYTTYITWSGNTVYFIRYGDEATDSNRLSSYTFTQTDLVVLGCEITDDKESVVIFTNYRGKIVSSPLSSLSITVEYQYTADVASVTFYSVKNDYRIIAFTATTLTTSNIVVVKNSVVVATVSQSVSTAQVLSACIDVAGLNLIYSDASGYGYVMRLSDSTILKTFTFLELDIDYTDSSTYPTTYTTAADKLAFIQSLAINNVQVFNDGSTDFIFFEGSFVFFIYKLSTFDAVKFKSFTLASSTLIGMFPLSGNLIIVGNVQVTYFSLTTFTIKDINFVGTQQNTNNDNFGQTYVDVVNDRVVILTVALQVSYYNLSTLKYQQLIMLFTNQSPYFSVDLIHDKLILYSKRSSANLSDGNTKYYVYVYQYSTGALLYYQDNGLVYSYDVLIDSTLGEYFFIQYLTGVITHYRFSSTSYIAPVATYTVPVWTSLTAIIIESAMKLVVYDSTTIYVFDYYSSTATYTYTQTSSTPLYMLSVNSYIVTQISGSNIQVLSTTSSSSSSFSSSSTGTVQATAFDKTNNYIFQASYLSSSLSVKYKSISTMTSIAELVVSTAEQASKIYVDSARARIVVIGTSGTYFVLTYNTTALTLAYSVAPYVATPYSSFVDTTTGYVHVFFSDYRYVKYNYVNNIQLKLQNLGQVVVDFFVRPDYTQSVITLTNQVLKLNYRDREYSRIYSTAAGTLNRFFEDPYRGIIVGTALNLIYVLNYWNNSTVIMTLNLEPTMTSAQIVFNDVKVSKTLDMIAFGSTITGASTNYLYVLTYSTFTLIKKLDHPNVSVRGSEFDETKMRLFVYCRLGSVFVWSISGTTFTLTTSKSGYLGSSTVNQIVFWPEKNIILMTSNSWWSKTLNYNTLEDINSAIPGILGFFQKDLLLMVMYDHLGQIWVYDFGSSATLFSQSVHSTRVNFVIITKEASYTNPTIISGSDDKYLVITREYTLSNRKYYLHTSELAVGFFDFSTQVIICGDKLGNILIFAFQTVTLSRIIKQHATAIIQLSFKQVSNVLITSANDGSIIIWDYYNIIQLELTGSLTGFYGINGVLQVDDYVYFTDAFGTVQQWNLAYNSLKYAFYQKRASNAYYLSTINQIPNTNNALLQFYSEFISMDLTTLTKTSLAITCQGYSYYSAVDLATCTNINSVQIVSSSLSVLTTLTITSPSSAAVKQIEIVSAFRHIILVQTSGNVVVYQYSTDKTTFSLLTSIPNSGISQVVKMIADSTNSLLILAYADGSAYYFTYTSSSISSKTTFTSIPYTSETREIAMLQVFNSTKLLVRRLRDNIVSILEYPSLAISRNTTATSDNYLDSDTQRPNVFFSPCTGKDESVDVSEEFSIVILSCNGVYNIYSTTNLTYINSVRQIYNITNKLYSFQRKRESTIRFLTKDFFIDAVYRYLFIFKINPSSTNVISGKEISLVGNYYNEVSGNSLSTISMVYVDGQTGVYAFEALQYAMGMIEQLTIPLVASTALCKLETSATLFLSALTSLETVYSQSISFSTVMKFQLVVQVTEGINLPYFPSFPYASISQILVAPTGVSNPPATADQSVRVKAYGSSTFFSSASQYLELYMNNLAVTFENTSTTVALCTLTSPLTIVDFSYLDISSNVPDHQIRFTTIPTVIFKEISITYTAATSSRLLATSADTYSQVLFFRFVTVTSLTVTSLSVESQYLKDTTIISVMNPSDPTTLTTALTTAKVSLTDITFKDNQLVSTVALASAKTTLNPLIQLAFVPIVIISDVASTGNYSPSQRVSGIIQTQACSSLTVSDSSFTSNSNLFFIFNNSTYSEEEESTSQTFTILKYYVLQNTKTILSALTLSSNQVSASIECFIRINSDTTTATGITANSNTLFVVTGVSTSKVTLINLLSSSTVTLTTLTFNLNQLDVQSLLAIDTCTLVTTTDFTVTSNTVQYGTIYVTSSILSLTASTFDSNTSSNSGAGIYISSSTITLDTITFSKHASMYGAAFYSTDSTLNLNSLTFIKNAASSQGGSIYAEASKITMTNSHFAGCSTTGSGGSAAIHSSTFSITGSSFTGSTATNYGGAVYSADRSTSTFTSISFTSNTAAEGGALYLVSCSDSSKIDTVTFTSNTAHGSGGALNLDTCNSGVTASRFLNNIAAIGGGLRYTGLLPTFLRTISESDLRSTQDTLGYYVIAGNYFKSNTGVVLGPDIGGVFAKISLIVESDDFTFTQLKVDDPNEKVGQTTSDFQYEFKNVRSGAKGFTYQIQIYDLLNQKITQSISDSATDLGFTLSTDVQDEIDAIRCKLIETTISTKLEEQNISLDGSVIVEYAASKSEDFFGFSFDSIQIIGIPSNSAGFCMSFDGLKRISSTYAFVTSECVYVSVDFRRCVVGEIYTPRCTNCIMNSCVVCASGTYSLVEPIINSSQTCQTCNTETSLSCSGSSIELRSGYWRENNTTDLIEACSDTYQACTGTVNTGYCATGYIGAICETCDSYGSFWKDRYGLTSLYSVSECDKCSDIQSQEIYQVIILIFIAVYIFFQMLSTNWNSVNYIKGSIVKQIGIVMVQTSLLKTEFSVLSKILIHYMSVQEVIDLFSLKNKDLQEKVYSVPKEFLFPISNLFHGFDCSISSPDSMFAGIPIEYARLLLTFVQCIAMLFVIILLYCLLVFLLFRVFKYNLSFIKAHYLSFSAVIGQILFFIYYMQQTITSSSIKIIACKSIGDKNYLASQLNKECYTEEYFRWFPLVFSTFVLSAFVYPFTIFLILNNNKDKFDQHYRYTSQRRYGFLYFEFKHACWWWEVMKIVLRQVIIIITQMSIFELLEKASLIMIILLGYLVLALFYRPYKSEKLNYIDLLMNLSTVLMIICAIYSSGVTSSSKQLVLTICLFSLKVLSLGAVGLRLVDSFLSHRMNSLVQNTRVVAFFSILSKCISERIFCRQGSILRRNFPSLFVLIYKPMSYGINKHYRWRLLQVHTHMYLKRRKDNPQANFFTESNLQISKHLDKTPKERVKDCFSKLLLKSYSKVRESVGDQQTTNTPKVSQFRTLNQQNSMTPTSSVSPNLNSILGKHFPHMLHTQTISDSRPTDLQHKDSQNNGPSKQLTNRSDFEGVLSSKNKLFSVENTFREQEEVELKELADSNRGAQSDYRLRFSSQMSLSMPNEVFIDADEKKDGEPINGTIFDNLPSTFSKFKSQQNN